MPKWIAGRQKDRERERDSLCASEKERESSREFPFGGPCARLVTWQLKLKSSMHKRGNCQVENGEMGNGKLRTSCFCLVSTQIWYTTSKQTNIMKTAWVFSLLLPAGAINSHPSGFLKPNYYDNLRTCKTFNWKPRKATGKNLTTHSTQSVSVSLIYDPDNYTKETQEKLQIGPEDVWEF